MEKNIQGLLKMQNLCFSDMSLSRNVEYFGKVEANVLFDIEYKKLAEKSVRVIISLQIKGQGELCIKMCEQADFELVNAEILDTDIQLSMLKANTVAIMLPYLRSQVSLLTTQPGMAPIQLPIYNAVELTKNLTLNI